MSEGYLTLNKLADQMRPFHNHICIVHDYEMIRLTGVSDGSGDDYYYCGSNQNGDFKLYSAVGWCYSLKPLLDPIRYEQLAHSFDRWAPETAEFMVEQNNED